MELDVIAPVKTVERGSGLDWNGRPISWIKFRCGGCAVQVIVKDLNRKKSAKLSKRLRRSVCLAIFSRVRSLIGLAIPSFVHADSDPLSTHRYLEREVGLAQVPRSESEQERAGLEMRLSRQKEGLTLNQLAKRAGLTPKHLGRIEHGCFVPRPSTLEKIHKALMKAALEQESSDSSELNSR